jgi:hypothetical protein
MSVFMIDQKHLFQNNIRNILETAAMFIVASAAIVVMVMS